MKRPTRRARMLRWAVVGAAALVAALLVLIGLGILTLPSPPAKTLTVVSAVRWIAQGDTVSGEGWFGPSYYLYNHTSGFPLTVTAGGTFTIVATFSNFDDQSHTIYSAAVNSPFSVSTSHPGLPHLVGASEDTVILQVVIGVPDQPGADLTLNLTLDALSP
jgi:hypothetical protein